MDAIALGLVLGVGLLLMAWAVLGVRAPTIAAPGWWKAWEEQVQRSEIRGLTLTRLLMLSAAAALVVALAVLAWTGVWMVALVVALVVAPMGQLVVASRAAARTKVLRRAWPDVVDLLVSGVRAGAGLPDLLCDLATEGPEALRPQFALFAAEYRASGRFAPALDALKAACADPVADRIVEALRLAREVGGSDLSGLLRDLGILLREDARTRGELEARQSWTVNAARLAVVAPWIVLVLVSTQPGAARVWNSPGGIGVLVTGALLCVLAYVLMQALGRLTSETRTLR
ncbi:type II secretion system F family protein [Schaalia sp. 19OD2882]|nr:type II secretion system F family protein [Schaalia sp. 19OD2882]QWW20611.1 type II secretion system F family protein [Schaalia sp. 19OD2882]